MTRITVATITREEVDWLKTLVSSYELELDANAARGEQDDDPSATFEMIQTVRHLAEKLEKTLPGVCGICGEDVVGEPGRNHESCENPVVNPEEEDIPF